MECSRSKFSGNNFSGALEKFPHERECPVFLITHECPVPIGNQSLARIPKYDKLFVHSFMFIHEKLFVKTGPDNQM
jgi:hypothetical protein